MMKFSNFFFVEDALSKGLKIGDEVVYKKKTYVIKAVNGDEIDLIDTSKTRGGEITVNKDDIEAVQMGIAGIGGERAPEHKKRKIRKDAGQKRAKDDSEQLSLF